MLEEFLIMFINPFHGYSGEEVFDSYLLDGGMSGSYAYKSREEKFNYIADVYDTLIVRDIRQKYKIRNTALMDKISEFMMENIVAIKYEGIQIVDIANWLLDK